MPTTRANVAKADKVAEIVVIAQRRLEAGGYGELSVAGIARELGVAQNAIYWYFPTKDHLFVAALRETLVGVAARKPRAEDVRTRMLWFTDQLEPVAQYRGAMLERVEVSPVVAAFVAELDGTLGRMLANAFTGRVPDADLPLAVESFRATVEGLYLSGVPRARRRQLLGYAFDRLAAS